MKNLRYILFPAFFSVACLGTEEPDISGSLITPECFRDSDCRGGSDELACMVPVCDPFTFTCGLVRPDRDEDGHPDRYCGGDDCDDGDETAFPKNAEICDNVDNNCNGDIDEDLDCNGVVVTDEVCDGLDNDLDGVSDEGLYTLDGRVSSLYFAKQLLLAGLNTEYVYLAHQNYDGSVGARAYSLRLNLQTIYDDILPEETGRTILDVVMHGAQLYILATYDTAGIRFLKWRAFDLINQTFVDSSVVAGATLGSLVATEEHVFVITYHEETGEVKWLVFDIDGALAAEYPVYTYYTYTRVGRVEAVDCSGNVGALVLSSVGSTLGEIEYFGFDPLTLSVSSGITLINLVESQDIYDFDFVCPEASNSRYLAMMAGTAVPGDDRVTLHGLLLQYDANLTLTGQTDLVSADPNVFPPTDGNVYHVDIVDTGFSLGATWTSRDRVRFWQFDYNLSALIDSIDITTSPVTFGPTMLWFNSRFAIFWTEDIKGTSDELILERFVSCED